MEGMTLRDYFAGKAMQSIYAGEGAKMVANVDGRYDGQNWGYIVATNAYMMADAMIAERKKFYDNSQRKTSTGRQED